jgi:S1-C subfamily serine protease
MMIRRDKPLCLAVFCLVVSLFVACMSCSPSLGPARTYNDHKFTSEVSNMAESVVAVALIKDNRIRLIGSAVVTRCEAGKPIRLVTAAHVPNAVVEYGGTDAAILIGSLNTKRYQQVKVVLNRTDQDLAILEGFADEERSCPSVPVATKLPEIGSPVWLVGNPMGHEKNITKGILSNAYFTKFFKDEPLVYRTDAACGPGNSGGGLFNDSGELIGILSFTELVGFGSVLPGGCHAIALPHIWIIRKDVDKPKKDIPTSQPDAGVPTEKR